MVSQPENILVPPAEPLPAEDLALVGLYQQLGIPTDQLPYTPQFHELTKRYAVLFNQQDNDALKHELFRKLANLRKAGRLPRVAKPVPAGDNPIPF